jgi:hypothetical protein
MWTEDNTWDEIMDRLIEMESLEIPYKSVAVFREGQKWKQLDNNENAFYRFSLGRYYTTLDVWFCPEGHAYWRDTCEVGISIQPGVTNLTDRHYPILPSYKAAAVYLLNYWEDFVSQKLYEEKYKEFKKWADALIHQ